MALSRAPQESEILVAIVAGQIAAQAPGYPPDIAVAVGTAERICEEIINRTDHGDPPPPMVPGLIFIDEHSSQRHDGSDKQRGISVQWKRGEEFGYEGDELTAQEANDLMAAIVAAVEKWNDEKQNGRFTVAYDTEPGEGASDE